MSLILMIGILPLVVAHRFLKSSGFFSLKHDAQDSSCRPESGLMYIPFSGFQKSFAIGAPCWIVSEPPGLEKYFIKSDENVKIFHYHDTYANPQVGAGLGYSALVADVDVKRCVLGHSDGRGLE